MCLSNFCSTLLSYSVGKAIYHWDLSIALPQESTGLTPSWDFHFPKLIGNDKAMFAGIFFALACSWLRPALAAHLSQLFEKAVSQALFFLTAIIPFFVGGFVVKLVADQVIANIVFDYSLIFSLVALSQFTYIALIYLFCNRFNIAAFVENLKNMLPAAIAGFSSMSSAAALPLTMMGTEKNTKNKPLTRLAIPLTVNAHLIGDCFAIPIFAFAVMKNYGLAEPQLTSYLLFALYFVIAKFSVAAIPGGGVIVMLPILESYLGFTSPMASLITALYILFDPVITCANVCGNGAFALFLNKLQAKVLKKDALKSEEEDALLMS
jgi:Na+/H+-dicarboxylate symporter